MKRISIISLFLILSNVLRAQSYIGAIISNCSENIAYGIVIKNNTAHVDISAGEKSFCANVGVNLKTPYENWGTTFFVGVSSNVKDTYFNGGFDVVLNLKFLSLSAGVATNQLGRVSISYKIY